MWMWPGHLGDDLELNLDDELFETNDNNRPGIDCKDAIEQNKTRDNCILCGKPTINKELSLSVIKYCLCVEEKINK